MKPKIELGQCGRCGEFDDVKNLAEIRSTEGEFLGWGCTQCVRDLIAYCEERKEPYRIVVK